MNTDVFTPTYLYIKRHRITGLLYFGKTINNDPEHSYDGSGVRWSNHCNFHGWDIETLWFCLFTDRDEIVKFALMCSEQWDIVKSEEWANLVPENGLDGTTPGSRWKHKTQRSEEYCKAMSDRKNGSGHHFYGKTQTDDHRRKNSEANTGARNHFYGRSHTDEAKRKNSEAHMGKTDDVGTRLKKSLSAKNKPRMDCPHCGKNITSNNFKLHLRFSSFCSAAQASHDEQGIHTLSLPLGT